jgi:hypothetical protein
LSFSTIGKRVEYGNKGSPFKGTVEDEVSLRENDLGGRDFLDLIQYVLWQDGTYGIRFCYYYRYHGSGDSAWRFSNRPLSTSPEELRKLLGKASKKLWFRDLVRAWRVV